MIRARARDAWIFNQHIKISLTRSAFIAPRAAERRRAPSLAVAAARPPPPRRTRRRAMSTDAPAEPPTDVQRSETAEALPSLFWEGDGESWMDETSDEFAALKALLREQNAESTPREIAERCKDKGNSSIKYAKANILYARYAVEHYTAGLASGCADDDVRGTLYCNRAHAGLLLKNNRKAYTDAIEATKMIPGNVKAWFRAAKAALALEMPEECARCCVGGLDVEGDNRDLKVMLREAKRMVEKREKQQVLDEVERARVRAYVEELKKRNLRLGPASLGAGEHLPRLNADSSEATYWTLFVYPESMQTDVVEAASEASTIGQHLDVLFDSSGPPLAWDEKRAYTRESVEVYWQTNAAMPYTWEQVEMKMLDAAGVTRRADDDDTRREIEAMEKGAGKVDARDQFMRRLDEKMKLGDLFRDKECVIAGHPVFYVVAKGTEFRQQFLDGEWEL